VKTGSHILTFETDQVLITLSFSDDGQSLRVGSQWFEVKTGLECDEVVPDRSAARAVIRGDWVILDGEEVLWLPPAYRATCSAMRGDVIALGLGSGRVTLLEFESERRRSRH
jgi:hypothetical protein